MNVSFSKREILKGGSHELLHLLMVSLIDNSSNGNKAASFENAPPTVIKREQYEETRISTLFPWDRLDEMGLLETKANQKVITEKGLRLFAEELDEQTKPQGKGRTNA